jgi:hypothetical protein
MTQKSNKSTERKLTDKVVQGVAVGRDKVIIPPNEITKLAAMGCKDTEICDWFGITGNTLRYNFSVELIKGRELMKQSLRQAMLTNAIQNNNATMQIWLSKNYLGMSDDGGNSGDKEPLPWIEGELDEEDIN